MLALRETTRREKRLAQTGNEYKQNPRARPKPKAAGSFQMCAWGALKYKKFAPRRARTPVRELAS